MDPLKRYFELINEYPHLFENTGQDGELTIIKDPSLINEEQTIIRKELEAKGKPTHWIDIGVLSEDEWYWVIRDLVKFPLGRIGGYIRMVNRKSNEVGGFNVVMICRQSSKILLIKKYHHETRDYCWEFPRGFGEANLGPSENAKKEITEEINAHPKSITILTIVKEGNGGTCIASAEISPRTRIKLEKKEGIVEYCWLEEKVLDQQVNEGKVTDWFTLWAYSVMKNKLIS